jgi:hypothetical protein
MANETSGELSDPNNNEAASAIRDKNIFFPRERSETTEETKKETKKQSLNGGTGETTDDGVEMDDSSRGRGHGKRRQTH